MDIIRRIAVAVVCLLMAVGSLEAKRPFVRVNGFEVSKHVTSIEMEGNMMSLRWNDNTVMRGRLADVMINLACRDCVDKARILSVSGVQISKMRVEGLALGSTYSCRHRPSYHGYLLAQVPKSRDEVCQGIAVCYGILNADVLLLSRI